MSKSIREIYNSLKEKGVKTLLSKEEIEKEEVKKWLQENEVPKFVRNYIKQLENKVDLKNFYKASFDETAKLATRTAEKKIALELENRALKKRN